MPEEKMFVYQNLHAQMEAAMLGLLQHNQGVYQVSLARLTSWIKKYFQQDAPLTVDILQQLQNLQAVKLQAPDANIEMTLQAFQQFLAQNNQAQIAVPQQPQHSQHQKSLSRRQQWMQRHRYKNPVASITVPTTEGVSHAQVNRVSAFSRIIAWLGVIIARHPDICLLYQNQCLIQIPLWFAALTLIVVLGVFYKLIHSIEPSAVWWFMVKNWLRLRREHGAYSRTQHV